MTLEALFLTGIFWGCEMSEWFTDAPSCDPRDAVRSWPIVQSLLYGGGGILWSEDLAAGKACTVMLGGKEVAGKQIAQLHGQIIGWRARWVHEEHGARPWSAGRPGEGWRSHVQVLIIGSSGKIALCTARGLSGGTLVDAVMLAEREARIAARDTGRTFGLFAFGIRLSAREPERADRGAAWVGWRAALAGETPAESYAGHEAYDRAMTAREADGIRVWEQEWNR